METKTELKFAIIDIESDDSILKKMKGKKFRDLVFDQLIQHQTTTPPQNGVVVTFHSIQSSVYRISTNTTEMVARIEIVE